MFYDVTFRITLYCLQAMIKVVTGGTMVEGASPNIFDSKNNIIFLFPTLYQLYYDFCRFVYDFYSN